LGGGIAAATVKVTSKLPFADAPDESVGQTLGRYKLLERLGEGGCGVVYVAEQTEPVRRRVALKVIKGEKDPLTLQFMQARAVTLMYSGGMPWSELEQ
jgi:hypothetical protein